MTIKQNTIQCHYDSEGWIEEVTGRLVVDFTKEELVKLAFGPQSIQQEVIAMVQSSMPSDLILDCLEFKLRSDNSVQMIVDDYHMDMAPKDED